MARLNAECLRATAIQYKTSVFYTLRYCLVKARRTKMNRLVRVWSCLIKNVAHGRIKRNMVQLLVKFNDA
jgi:hypothetical protein